jgi:hypothetical protein
LFILLAGSHLATPRLDSDQAVTGLMGIYILRGDFPIVFWGQHHAGIPESYGAAVTFAALGVSRFALCLVPAFSALGLTLLVYRTGRVLFGPEVGVLAVLFMTVVSPYVFAHYVRARSYYIEHLLLGQVVLLGAALCLTHGHALSESARSRVLIAMGLAGGVGLYCGFQIVDALLPAVVVLILVDLRLPLRRAAWLGVGAFALGSLPFWVYNLRHDWATFGVGVSFQGGESAAEAGRILFRDLLPIVLGVREWVDTVPYFPWPMSLVIPVAVGAVLVATVIRAVRSGGRQLRDDPALGGEALLLLAVLVTVGIVWYGRFVRVPRYLVPIVPPLALLQARACQLTWRRAPVMAMVATGLYLTAVGLPLLRDVTVLWPERRTAYRAERAADEALLAFLRAHQLTRAYAFDYWLAPRLTFDARAEIIVAEAWNERYPPHAAAVNGSSHPAYILRADPRDLDGSLASLGVRAHEDRVPGYTIVHDFTVPPDGVPLARTGWTVRTSDGRGAPATVVDTRLDTGWAAARGGPHSAWVEVDLGADRTTNGVVLVTDQPDHIPERLLIQAERDRGVWYDVTTTITNGVAAEWINGAPRVRPNRTLTIRFPPVATRRLRLVEAGPAERWSVAELFLLEPPGAGLAAPQATGLLHEGQALEMAGQPESAIVRYHEVMRMAPDAADGYEGFARLATELRLRGGSPVEQAARFTRLGLLDEARTMYADIAGGLEPGQTNAELARARARLAETAGDAPDAARLETEAAKVFAPARPVGVVLGRVVELLGYDVTPIPVRVGEPVEVTTHWRLFGTPPGSLMVWLQFRGDDQAVRFGDNYPLPAPVKGLSNPQHVSVSRGVTVPTHMAPGRYRVVAGVWNQASDWRLHRWWHRLVPLLETTLRLGTVEIVGPGD